MFHRLGVWAFVFLFSSVAFGVIDCSVAKRALAGPSAATYVDAITTYKTADFSFEVLPPDLHWQDFTVRIELNADKDSPPIVGYVENIRIRFETPKGNRYVFLSQWEMMRDLGKLDLLHKSLNNASYSKQDVLKGIEMPGSLAALYRGGPYRPGLAEILDGVYTQRVIINKVLHELSQMGNVSPTLWKSVNKAADIILARLQQQRDMIASMVAEEGLKNFLTHFDLTLDKIQHEIDKALRDLDGSDCRWELFDRRNPAHVSWITKVVNRVQGDSGELMFAIRVEGFEAKGVPVAKFPADAKLLGQVEKELRQQALRFFWLKKHLAAYLRARGVPLENNAEVLRYLEAHSAEVGANLRTTEPADYETHFRAVEKDEAVRQWVESRFAVQMKSMDAVNVSFQRSVKVRAAEEQQKLIREKIRGYLESLSFIDVRFFGIDVESETDRFMNKEIDLLYAGFDFWAEVKNYSDVVTLNMLRQRRGGKDKAMLEQAEENVILAHAIMGPQVKVYQFATNGFTLDAAMALRSVGVNIAESSIVFPNK